MIYYRKIAFIVFFFFITTLCANRCNNNLPPDEKYFKEKVIKLNKVLEGYFDIEVAVTKEERHDDKNVSYSTSIVYRYDKDDIKKREIFFQENKDAWIKLDQELKNFAKKFPKSEWCDDASLYRVFEAIIAKYPNQYWSNHLVESATYFINNYEVFKIDDWTKTKMDTIFPNIFDEATIYRGTAENELINAAVYNMLIGQYCSDAEFSNAKAILKKLEKAKLSDATFANGLKEYIEFIENKSSK
jgi:hypothetical protein